MVANVCPKCFGRGSWLEQDDFDGFNLVVCSGCDGVGLLSEFLAKQSWCRQWSLIHERYGAGVPGSVADYWLERLS